MVSKVQTLAPTDGIKDPQVRAFCDSLANAWQLRNGNTGADDKERFITKQEWDFLAKNPNIRAIAGVGQEGASVNESGQPGTGTAPVGAGGAFVVPPWIQNLVDFLAAGITMIDFDEFRKAQSDMWTTIYRLTSDTGGSTAGLSLEITARTSSDNALATQLNKLWAEVGNENPANALVLMGAKVDVNPIAGVAQIFNQVQAAVTGANGQVYQAAGKSEFTAYVNADTADANASYTLQVQAQAGGVKAVTGMYLYADAGAGSPKSAVIFLTDQFAIYHDNVGTVSPFFVSKGTDNVSRVRINIAHIKDFIRSDIYVKQRLGWQIKQDGSAEFNGVSLFGKIYAGTTLLDRDSNQIIPGVASGAMSIDSTTGTDVKTSASLRFYGPNNHGSSDIPHRIRQGDNINVNLPTTVTCVGIADHYLSIWRRHNGVGGWQCLNTAVEPGNDYGAATVVWAGETPVSISSFWEFGVSCTANNSLPKNPAKIDLLSVSVFVTMTNI